eukprot:CAMPEP_0195512374 /NCGR_PEP_ID=MMETSP0794_2-20130614/4351_1 /TAXON_ID=515487 /ORGANISM="Stephanopyxis turris, Strain CCMP 815" /LENGTH=1145 /DNA_ID=CAMNT_0040640147 /DNA_START=40 /DNA_END=3477 /DNA_ORIENTATION=+
MSSMERLDLLKEVAGCTVYDEKRADSIKQMEENAGSREKIKEVLDYIDTRLGELQDEKEELTEYQKLDRKRRAMEYTLYDKELRKAREQLDEIEHVRTDDGERLTQLHEETRITHDAIRTVEARMKQTTNKLRRNLNILTSDNGLETENTLAMTRKTQLELEIKELEEQMANDEAMKNKLGKELKALQTRIERTQAQLNDTVLPQFTHAKEVVQGLTREQEDAAKKMQSLYAKQGRGRQYRSKSQRDAFLRTQISDLDSASADKRSDLQSKEESLAGLRYKIESDTEALEAKRTDITKKSALLSDLTSALDEKKKIRNELATTRKEKWRELEDVGEKLSEARDAQSRALSDLRKSMPRATSMGLEALRKIVQNENIPSSSYLGPVMENFELKDPKFQTAIEVAAQNALFHIIVDTDATAARLMKKLEQHKLGRVTFLPLNQLSVDRTNYPESNDVVPIINRCISFHPVVSKAMQHVFGKKLLAKTVDAASTFSASHSMDAITLDGDLVSRKGALVGGYVDVTKSKLSAHYKLINTKEILHNLEREHVDLQKKATAVDQRVSALMGEMQRTEAKHANLLHIVDQTERDIDMMNKRVESRKRTIEEVTEMLPMIAREIASIDNQKTSLEEEMGTPLTANLSDAERAMLQELSTTTKEMEKQIMDANAGLEDVSVTKHQLQSLLQDNLYKRKEELENAIQAVSEGGSRRRANRGSVNDAATRRKRLQAALVELDEAERLAEETKLKLEESQGEDAKHKAELVSAKDELEKLKKCDMKCKQELENASDRAERLLNKRSMCISKREMYMRKIQELGSLPPSSELNEHTSLSIQSLLKSLEKCNKNLKKYSHVNKKAYDQYVNFSEQREQLLGRKTELDQGAEKVKELIESLDRQKDEAINRTFRGVSAHFKEVFSELVPNGSGELMLRTAIEEDNESSAEGEENAGTDSEGDPSPAKKGRGRKKKEETEATTTSSSSSVSVSLYRGVDVKVRFSRVGENYLMSQLSGGQKALVAMGLIFAIQRCDPAPFYLFDELDQALDSTYRAAVANMIQRQSNNEDNPTQFICSTFRPELVGVSNRCFGISHQNKESKLHMLSKKDALHFIANLMSEEEAVGEATSLATSRHTTASLKKRQRKDVPPKDESSVVSEE